jgi:hypothetical protein
MPKKLCVLLALFACTLSGCSQVNTKIGMPWVYWEHGFLALVGFLAVCVLIFYGLCFVIGPEQAPGEILAGVMFWLVAGFLLQALPYNNSGIQFVPLPPWYYSSWMPWIVSVTCWLALIIGWGLNCSSTKADRDTAVAAILIALGLNALLSFAEPMGSTRSTTNIASIESCPATDQWEAKKQQQTELLNRLSSEKDRLETRIRNLGIKTKKELMKDPIARPLVEELEQLISQIGKVQSNVSAIVSVQSKLRTLEREKSLNNGLSSEELTNISEQLKVEILNRADDPLPSSVMQRDKLLDGLIRPH